MLSTVTVGEAAVTVAAPARTLVGQFLLYGLCAAIGAGSLLAIVVGLLVAFGYVGDDAAGRQFDAATFGGMIQTRLGHAASLIIGIYLSSCRHVRRPRRGHPRLRLLEARRPRRHHHQRRQPPHRSRDGEDTALAGEGLADALNVGAY